MDGQLFTTLCFCSWLLSSHNTLTERNGTLKDIFVVSPTHVHTHIWEKLDIRTSYL